MRSRLLGWKSSLARATRAFSPPDSTDIGLRTSSPLNRKPPRVVRRFRSGSLGAVYCSSSMIVLPGLRSSMTCCA